MGVATIRETGPDDLDEVAAVHHQAWLETYRGLLPESWFAEHDEAWFRELRQYWAENPRPGRRQWVAEAGGSVVGFASSGPSRSPDLRPAAVRALELYAIYVLAAHHGTGVGRALLSAAVGEAPAEVWVARDNPRAREFYGRHGFVADGAEVSDPGLCDLVEIRMVR
jgi:GNAT superfamily N-acetyltransferase